VKFAVAFIGIVTLLVILNNTGLLRTAVGWFAS
jgi:hypothetical protein